MSKIINICIPPHLSEMRPTARHLINWMRITSSCCYGSLPIGPPLVVRRCQSLACLHTPKFSFPTTVLYRAWDSGHNLFLAMHNWPMLVAINGLLDKKSIVCFQIAPYRSSAGQCSPTQILYRPISRCLRLLSTCDLFTVWKMFSI